ncbi:Ig domain-containing protein [Micromonospora sp. NPDC093277]|uniref:Ig domain-containing protein n=1 Tax=Micromonospora sp. NPDC093277 TaxID=3364291 RepID=UPI00382CCACE
MSDANGFFADQNVMLVIADPAATITSGDPHEGTVGEAYSFRFTAAGDSGITFSVAAGDLPDGLTLAPDGLLSGTPKSAGSFSFTVKATGTATSAEAQVTVSIADAPSASPTSTPTTTPDAASPSATSGPGLPVTGSSLATMLLLGVAAIAVGGMILIVLRARRQRFTADG